MKITYRVVNGTLGVRGFCSNTSNASLWRTFLVMERGRQPPDPAAHACFAAKLGPEDFAKEAARAFFPFCDVPPVRNLLPCPRFLPARVDKPPLPSDVEGMGMAFTMAELLAAIDCGKRKTAPGPDAIPYEAFKNLKNDVLAQLYDSINEVWLRGVVPGSWKAAYVVPVPKPGKPAMVLENLRPISLTVTICKLVEKMLASRLSWWLEQHGYTITTPRKSGFAHQLARMTGLVF